MTGKIRLMERKSEQPTFVDAAASELGGPRTAAFLDQCERLIPWEDLAAGVSDVFAEPTKGGVPVWRPSALAGEAVCEVHDAAEVVRPVRPAAGGATPRPHQFPSIYGADDDGSHA